MHTSNKKAAHVSARVQYLRQYRLLTLERDERLAQSKQGSALIMVVLTLSLMVTVAISFMNIVGRKKATAINVALQTYADIATQQAQAHLTRAFVATAESGGKTDAGTNVPYVTNKNALWKQQFDAIADVDTNVSEANSSDHLWDMTGLKVNSFKSRWYNHVYLTSDLKTIDMPDSLTAEERLDLQKTASYVVRYTAQPFDGGSKLAINNNYPLNDDADNAIRNQNYMREYGRNLKSMLGASSPLAGQYRIKPDWDKYLTLADPLDHESVAYKESGTARDTGAYGALSYDIRLHYESTFRDGDLHYSGSGNSMLLGPMQKGRIYTWGAFNLANLGVSFSSNGGAGLPDYFEPYGDGIPVDLSSPRVGTPWKINLLAAERGENDTIKAMILGLSSEAKTNWSKTGSTDSAIDKMFANADLFGRGYPEPFPLELDAGEDLNIGVAAFSDSKLAYPWINSGDMSVNYRNSYIVKIVIALTYVINTAQVAWRDEGKVDSDNSRYNNLINKYYIKNSKIKVNMPGATPEDMINAILYETYVVLGEHLDGATPMSYLSGDQDVTTGAYGTDLEQWRKKTSNIHPDANSRAMEYVLNDYMISLFGKANPNFTVGSAINDESIAYDFNGDGHAESTVTGWWDYNNDSKVWSWWWEGLGPFVDVSADNDYMKRPGWYRFDGSTVKRKVGSQWVAIADTDAFERYNKMWLKGLGTYPIKAFAKTGRLYVGGGQVMYGFIRGEVYNLQKSRVEAVTNRNFVYRVDPDGDGNYNDNTLLIQTELNMIKN